MPVFELRGAITTEECDQLVALYRDSLGSNAGDMWTEHGRGQVLDAGRATVEVFDTAHRQHVDDFEVGERVSGQIRFAREVPDIHLALDNPRY